MRKKLTIVLAAAFLAGAASAPGFAYPQDDAAKSSKKMSKAEKKQRKLELLKTAVPVIWVDPGDVARLDFANGPGGADGAPVPPFTFVEEKMGGTAPKVEIKDARGRTYGVKFGGEVRSENVATRIAWAAGYFVEPAYFVRNGKIEGVTERKRTKYVLSSDGRFEEARFELKPENLGDFEDEESWSFNSGSPFANTKELDGLKIVMMVTSNWDNKGVEDAFRGSNTTIYLIENGGRVEARYYVSDWGGSMGKFGGFFGRNKWDAEGYLEQSPNFVTRSGNGLEWAYSGQHGSSFWRTIRPESAAWVAGYLDRITDEQLRAAFQYVEATPQETDMFVKGFRLRVQQLKALG